MQPPLKLPPRGAGVVIPTYPGRKESGERPAWSPVTKSKSGKPKLSQFFLIGSDISTIPLKNSGVLTYEEGRFEGPLGGALLDAGLVVFLPGEDWH